MKRSVTIDIPDEILGCRVTDVNPVFTIHITPADAQRIKDQFFNEKNRHISKDVVIRYAQAMKDGDWKTNTNEPIGILKGGAAILDGHHRIAAIIASGRDIDLRVIPEVEQHFGTGLKRTLTHLLKMIYDRDTSDRAIAALRACYEVEGKINWTEGRIQKAFIEHAEALAFTLSCFHKKRKNVSQAAVMAAFLRAYYREDHDRLKEFAHVLMTGETQNIEAPDAANKLYRQLTEGLPSAGTYLLQGANRKRDIYRRTEVAIYNFCRFNNVKSIRVISQEARLYPLPTSPS